MHKAEARTPSRRRRCSGTTTSIKALSGGSGGGERLGHEDGNAVSSSSKEFAETGAPSRLWALLRIAQEEMERGADILGGELSKLWQNLHSVEVGWEAAGVNESRRATKRGGGDETMATARRRGDRRDSGSGGVNGKTSAVEAPASRSRIPPEEAAELLDGLGKLQAEMHAEARSFQRRKSDIVNRVESLAGARSSRRGRCDRDEVIRLEVEAESMRAAIVASRSRLLERVRKLQRLARGSARMSTAAATLTSASTTASYDAITVPTARQAAEGDSRNFPAGGNIHGLDDLVNAEKMVLEAREELAGLQHEVEEARADLAREHERIRKARDQASRLDAVRSSAASITDRADQDASAARAETGAVMHALETAHDGLAAAQVAHRTAEKAAESERARLESLRREAIGLEDDLRATERKVREEEVRAQAVREAVRKEEARLADCRDSFGFEVEGLQKGVGELESEAVGWRETLRRTRSRLAAEEKQGQEDKKRMEAEKSRLEKAIAGLKTEAQDWRERLQGLRRQHESDGEYLAREARKTTVELREIKSKVSEARSNLNAAQTDLQAVDAVIEEKVVSNNTAEVFAASLERRAVELEANIVNLREERDHMTREGEAERRRQAEELAHWKEAMAKRLQEYENLSERVKGKASLLGDLERNVREAQATTKRVHQAKGEQECAEDRAAAAIRAAHEAARLAETGKEKTERMEARAAAAETRTAEAVEKLRRMVEEMESESSCLESVKAELHVAKQAAADAQEETARARQQLVALSEKRRKEDSAVATARQRAEALAREEVELRATAITARRDGGQGREAAAAARRDLEELREEVNKERRTLEGFRDTALAVGADISRKREEDRFAREAADAQLARLDDIKREVTLLRDERLVVEKSVWSLKSELEALSARRSDAIRRERRREREEGALEARREALAAAVASEEERVGLSKTKREKLVAEVADLDARARALASEVNNATHEAAGLREDAAVAAGRAEEARRRLADLARDKAQLSSEVDTLRATKISLNSELAGLRKELETLQVRIRGEWRGPRHWEKFDTARESDTKRGESIDGTGITGIARARCLEEIRPVGEGSGNAWERDKGVCQDEVVRRGVMGSGCGVGGGDCGNLVDIVAEFQGRLRRQVRAALAEGQGVDAGVNRKIFTPVSREGEDQARSKPGEGVVENVVRVEHRRGAIFLRTESSRDVLGELDRRIGSV